jgi:predicted DsbA family dithiol-disulfide isomerase
LRIEDHDPHPRTESIRDSLAAGLNSKNSRWRPWRQGAQGKLWNFVDVFYREQGPEFTGYVDEPFLHRIATRAGVDLERSKDDRASEPWDGKLEADEDLEIEKRMRSTPSFLIGPTGGSARRLRHFSLEEPEVFEEAIRRLV